MRDAIDWCREMIGPESVVVSAAWHRDEAAPARALHVRPPVHEGKLSWKAVRDAAIDRVGKKKGQRRYSALHDDLYRKVSSRYGLGRGKVKGEMKYEALDAAQRAWAAAEVSLGEAKLLAEGDEEAERRWGIFRTQAARERRDQRRQAESEQGRLRADATRVREESEEAARSLRASHEEELGAVRLERDAHAARADEEAAKRAAADAATAEAEAAAEAGRVARERDQEHHQRVVDALAAAAEREVLEAREVTRSESRRADTAEERSRVLLEESSKMLQAKDREQADALAARAREHDAAERRWGQHLQDQTRDLSDVRDALIAERRQNAELRRRLRKLDPDAELPPPLEQTPLRGSRGRER